MGLISASRLACLANICATLVFMHPSVATNSARPDRLLQRLKSALCAQISLDLYGFTMVHVRGPNIKMLFMISQAGFPTIFTRGVCKWCHLTTWSNESASGCSMYLKV
jgi:hypothetical protein